MQQSEDLDEIRRAVRALCADFPGEYWREKDRDRAQAFLAIAQG